MKRILFIVSIFVFGNCLHAQNILNQVQNQVNNAIGQGNGGAPKNDEIIRGLKEALSIGTKKLCSKCIKIRWFL